MEILERLLPVFLLIFASSIVAGVALAFPRNIDPDLFFEHAFGLVVSIFCVLVLIALATLPLWW